MNPGGTRPCQGGGFPTRVDCLPDADQSSEDSSHMRHMPAQNLELTARYPQRSPRACGLWVEEKIFSSTALNECFRWSKRCLYTKKICIHTLTHRLCTRKSALCTGYPQTCKTRRFVRCPARANVAETLHPGYLHQNGQQHWNPSIRSSSR